MGKVQKTKYMGKVQKTKYIGKVHLFFPNINNIWARCRKLNVYTSSLIWNAMLPACSVYLGPWGRQPQLSLAIL